MPPNEPRERVGPAGPGRRGHPPFCAILPADSPWLPTREFRVDWSASLSRLFCSLRAHRRLESQPLQSFTRTSIATASATSSQSRAFQARACGSGCPNRMSHSCCRRGVPSRMWPPRISTVTGTSISSPPTARPKCTCGIGRRAATCGRRARGDRPGVTPSRRVASDVDAMTAPDRRSTMDRRRRLSPTWAPRATPIERFRKLLQLRLRLRSPPAPGCPVIRVDLRPRKRAVLAKPVRVAATLVRRRLIRSQCIP
jgi:hypothetical protein